MAQVFHHLIAKRRGQRHDVGMARAIAAIVLTMTGTPHFATANDHADASGLYVSPHGSDEGDGTRKAPFRTIPAASRAAGAGTTIHVAPGRYPGVSSPPPAAPLQHPSPMSRMFPTGRRSWAQAPPKRRTRRAGKIAATTSWLPASILTEAARTQAVGPMGSIMRVRTSHSAPTQSTT